jgi:hypothetical protein
MPSCYNPTTAFWRGIRETDTIRNRTRLLLVPVRRSVVLSRFGRVMCGVRVVSVRYERVVTRLLVITRLMMLRGLAVVHGCALVMIGGAAVVLGAVVGCHNPSWNGNSSPGAESLSVRALGGHREGVTPL